MDFPSEVPVPLDFIDIVAVRGHEAGYSVVQDHA